MNQQSNRKRYLPYWLTLIFIAALLPTPPGGTVVLAQGVPAACLKDNGQPVQVAPVIGAWALALNFNHVPSLTSTVGCQITTIALNPQRVSYTSVTCTINNNINNIAVGGGAAPFDGTFWVTCPNGPPVPGYGPLYDGFTIYGRAQFPSLTAPASFKIMEHPDVSLTAKVNANAQIKLTSRYGAYSYDVTDTSTNVVVAPIYFASAVGAGIGRHQIEATIFPFTTPVDQFPFSFASPLIFGKAQAPWTLMELVVDPPPPRGGLSG